jgi:hypothetical protein
MRTAFGFLILVLALTPAPADGAQRTIGVFVALADNKSQGIVPVPAAIGNGDDPEGNLYWGNSEGLKGCFDHSRQWKPVGKTAPRGSDILRTRAYCHVRTGALLTAFAYRGSAIRRCLTDFESAVQNGSYDLVVYIGHNGLMDFNLPAAQGTRHASKSPDCAVLCCKSDSYFGSRLRADGARPILLTTQLMYPGAFILAAAAETWLAGGSVAAVRESSGAAYAMNQKISRRAGTGIFAVLKN